MQLQRKLAQAVSDFDDLSVCHVHVHVYITWHTYILVVPGVVQNLVCVKSSSPTELTFSWELPTVLGNEVVEYRVEVKGLQHRAGTRDVEQFDVAGFNTEIREATVSQGLGNKQMQLNRRMYVPSIPLQLVKFPITSQ